MKVVIMAGGRGTRIASVNNEVPKPMIEICGKPILEWQIDNLCKCGLTDITLVVGYLGNIIQEYFGDGSKFGVTIKYYVETEPLGTAGALFKMPDLKDDFLLLCGDLIFNIDFHRLITFHHSHNGLATLVAHPNDHPYDSSLLVTEVLSPKELGELPINTHKVIRWINKEDERLYYSNCVNAGIEIFSPKLLKEALKNIESGKTKVDLDRDVLKSAISSGNIFAYTTTEYIKDMGTPDRYLAVEKDIRDGKVEARNLTHQQKAIFLDRDGTINEHIGFITDPSQFELLPEVTEAIKRINNSGYLAIVVTNQPVIARGECSWEELQTIHNKMETELGKDGAFLDGIYICPHHPDKGFEGECIEYKKACTCRKPGPGLILKAAKDYNIDLAHSFIIGDSDRDIEAGEKAGLCQSIKIETNKAGALTSAISTILQ